MRVAQRIPALAVAVFGALAISMATPAGAMTVPQKQAMLYQELASVRVFNSMYAHRAYSPYNTFNWSTDLCSFSPNRPFGFNFSRPCRRHDFNYRNFKDTRIFTALNKAKIDWALYTDIKAICASYSLIQRAGCNTLALAYYKAVRTFGR